jgi:hypothetical protein
MRHNVFTRSDGPLDPGWLQGLLNGQRHLQSVSLTVYFDRDCWRWWETERFKGSIHFYAGPLVLELGA